MKAYQIAGVALALSAGAAMAQTTSTVVDISPVRDSVISLLGVIVTGMLTWVGWAVKSWLNSKIDLSRTQTDENIQQMFNERVARAMAYAESIAKEKIPSKIDVNSEFVAVAARYFIAAWPDLAAKIPVDKIKDAIIARLPTGPFTEKADAIVEAKASAPVTTK